MNSSGNVWLTSEKKLREQLRLAQSRARAFDLCFSPET